MMKRTASNRIARDLASKIVMVSCLLLIPAGANARRANDAPGSVPCTVTGLRFRIVTADDDLRGGADNLNIIIYLANGRQTASNVNKGQNWKNDSVNTVDIALDQPVPLAELQAFRLVHVPDNVFKVDVGQLLLNPYAGFNIVADALQSPDKWNMASLEVSALGKGVGARVATHGYHSFAPGDPDLTVYAKIPANSCGAEERYGQVNPGAKTVQSVNSIGSKYGTQKAPPSTSRPITPPTPQQLQNNKLIQQAIAHTIQIGPRAGASGGDGGYSTLIGLLRKQSTAAHSLLLPASPVNRNQTNANNNGGTLLNGGSKVALNPQPYPPQTSQPMLGATQTMSAPENSSGVATQTTSASSRTTENVNLMPGAAANSPTPTNGPTAQRPPAGHQQTTQLTGAHAPTPTQICKGGIGTVDGGTNEVWFSPVTGQDGQFVIRGCGFGSAPGEVYLSGVQYDPANAKGVVQHLGSLDSPDRVYFQTPPNNWSDRQIIAQIDANASGLYDTNNVTLNVKTASGQVYQAIEMNFLAARADQPLNWIVSPPSGYSSFVSQTSTVSSPTAVVQLTAVADSSGNQMVAAFESPSASTTWQNETVDVIRAKLGESTPSKTTFPGGTDTFQLNLAPGFELDPDRGIEVRHTQIDVAQCQTSFNGDYSTDGTWSVSYTSTKSFEVSWQEQACWPKAGTQGVNPMDYGSVSAYALEVTILGPRGTSPWGSGKVNPLAIKQIQPVQMLPKN